MLAIDFGNIAELRVQVFEFGKVPAERATADRALFQVVDEEVRKHRGTEGIREAEELRTF